MITWEKFESAVRSYPEIADYDQSYEELMGNQKLINELRTNPSLKEIHKIMEFLNKWKCRIKYGDDSAKILLSVIAESLQLLDIIRNYNINDIDFDWKIHGNKFNLRIKDLIILLYSKFRHVDFKFGATATAKILHILAPDLLVMWDKAILEYYQIKDPRVSDSGPGYVQFLILMREIAIALNNEFQSSKLHHSLTWKDPASYLSMATKCNHPKTFAKYLDEYNWVTITRNNA